MSDEEEGRPKKRQRRSSASSQANPIQPKQEPQLESANPAHSSSTAGLPPTPDATPKRSANVGELKRKTQTERSVVSDLTIALGSQVGHTSYQPGQQFASPSGAVDQSTPAPTPTASTQYSTLYDLNLNFEEETGKETSGQSNRSGASGETQWSPPREPRDRLDDAFTFMDAGVVPDGGIGSTSAQLCVTSGTQVYPQQYLDLNDHWKALLEKTRLDLPKLSDNGFEINFTPEGQLGEKGSQGVTYRGVYNQNILQSSVMLGTRMDGVAPDQAFAAKYVQFRPQYAEMERIKHENERRILKALKHPNIVSFKIAINLGKKRYFVHKMNQKIRFVSYDRIFLVMDLADSSLKQFIKDGKVTEQMATKFAKNLCDGMNYMHNEGVIHMDPHWANVLVFGDYQNPDTLVAKWTDFDLSLSRSVCQQWGVTIDAKEFEYYRRKDYKRMALCTIDELAKYADVLKQLSQQLIEGTNTLQQILKTIHVMNK